MGLKDSVYLLHTDHIGLATNSGYISSNSASVQKQAQKFTWSYKHDQALDHSSEEHAMEWPQSRNQFPWNQLTLLSFTATNCTFHLLQTSLQ